MAYSKQLLVALLLGVMAGRASAVEGDVLAASDFRSGTQGWELKGLGSATGSGCMQDLADAKDNIMVYGEDDVYLGTIFAGNLTYLKEGHRAYDAYGAHTQCSGDLHDPAIAGSGDKARLADPHHPLGYIPQHKGCLLYTSDAADE